MRITHSFFIKKIKYLGGKEMKKRVISIFLCVAMTASMLIGCGSSSDKKEDKSETSTESKGNDLETDTVRLALAGSAHIFNAIAEEQGYLEDEGLTVEYVNCENSEGAFQSLAAGKVDVLSNYGTNLPLQYIGSGTDLTMFAGYMITGCMPIIAKKGTTWNGVEDMVGKTVACEPNVFAVSGALLDKGYDPLNDVKWLSLDNHTDRIEAVRSGEADYAVLGTGMMYNVTQMDDIDIVSYCSDVTPNYSCCRVEANTKWINENPNTVKALLRAWLRAQEWYEGHKDESKAIVAKTLETDEDYVAAYMDNEHYRLNLDPFKSSIERAWGYMLKLNLFDEGAEDINIDDHINTELYKAALDECIDKYHDENPDFYDTMLETYNEYDK